MARTKVGEIKISRPSFRRPAGVPTLPTLEEVKRSVSTLAESAKQSVTAVRDAFTSGIPPYQTAGSGSVSSYVASFAQDPLASKIVQSTSRLGLATSTAGSSIAPPKPELDSAEVFESRRGVLDSFCVRVTVSIPFSDLARVKGVRLMRAKMGSVKAPRPSISALSAAPGVMGKNLDSILSSQRMIDEIGVGNRLVDFISDSSISSKSISSPDAREIRTPVPPTNTNRTSTSAGLVSVAGADRSVLENLKFYLNRRSVGDVSEPALPSPRAFDKVGVNILKGSSVSSIAAGIVQSPNAMEFVEISKIDPTGPMSRRVGDFLEFDFIDQGVVYGASFVYYAACVGGNGETGPRSRLVKVNVLRSIPPRTPSVDYSLVAGRPRFVIRCEAGANHVEIFRTGRSVSDSIVLGSENSLVTRGSSKKIGQYWHVSDVGLGPDGSTTFVDTTAVPGDKLSYRIYSVDPYGLKSQTPFSCSIKVPEDGRPIPLPVPTITAEQAIGSPAIKINMGADDDRITGFIIQRKDVSVRAKSVHQPNQPEYVDLGTFTPKRSLSRQGPHLKDSDWPLYIPAFGGSASYLDSDVRVDRVYQYAVGAIDKRGNRTALAGSAPVGVYVRSIIDSPTALSASVSIDSGVLLAWTPGTFDFSPNSLLDDQDVLAATAVRSVFQVERRQLGHPFWDAMPATSESYFVDKISLDSSPSFRPSYAIPGEEYEYRVTAMQSGGFVSPRTDSIRVKISPPPKAPDALYVRSTPLEVNPIAVVVSWDMPNDFVERWEVERAVMNRLYSSQITSMEGLGYAKVADITPESSRARSLTADDSSLDKNVFVGNRFYIDSDVNPMNGYFYRVRTVGRLGVYSDWTYAGAILKDAALDQKFFSTLSDERKLELSNSPREIETTSFFRKRV